MAFFLGGGGGMWSLLSKEVLIGIAGAVVATFIIFLLTRAWPHFVRSVKFWGYLPATVSDYRRLRAYVQSGAPLWQYRPSRTKLRPEGSPVAISFLNFKGGVGKTTLAANFAAYCAVKRGLRVLIFDLDYQTSMTRLLLRHGNPDATYAVLSNWLLSSRPDRQALARTPALVAPLHKMHPVTVDLNLSAVEEIQYQKWLLKMSGDDIRTRLFRHIYQNEFMQNFDVVIFDAPPRSSVSAVNGLIASSHVIVPTKFEPLSAESISLLVEQLKALREQFGVNFRLAGVVGNMTYAAGGPTQNEASAINSIREALSEAGESANVFKRVVPDRKCFRQPELAYLLDGADGLDARQLIDAIGDEIAEAVNLPMRGLGT